jgi:SPP1 family predicted phage head-tail adaptor
MIIGKADRRIEFEKPTATVNAYGEESLAWASYATVWAELVRTSSMKETATDMQDAATTTVIFKVRSSASTRIITPKYRVNYNGNRYDITGIEEIGRNDQLQFTCVLDASTYNHG